MLLDAIVVCRGVWYVLVEKNWIDAVFVTATVVCCLPMVLEKAFLWFCEGPTNGLAGEMQPWWILSCTALGLTSCHDWGSFLGCAFEAPLTTGTGMDNVVWVQVMLTQGHD